MASSQVYCRPYCNLLLSGKDELTKKAPIKDSNIYILTLPALHAFTPTPTSAPPSTNKLFK